MCGGALNAVKPWCCKSEASMHQCCVLGTYKMRAVLRQCA